VERSVELSNVEKVLYPEAGFTKGQIAAYYQAVAPVLVPHLAGRPLTVVRYPEGVAAQGFFEKHCPDHRPDWVRTEAIKGRGTTVEFCVCDDAETLLWLSQLAAIELHPALARAEAIDNPDYLVFDLDPGAPATIRESAQVGIVIRDLLAEMGLEIYAKTTGSKGLHLYVPLDGSQTYEETKPFAKGLAQALEASLAGQVVSKQKKELRKGKVLVDWSQNDPGKTTVAVYSLRARPRPTVSTPVTWEEVEACAAGDTDLVFEVGDVLERVDARGDLFVPMLEGQQTLPEL
jgi:bifunctional non-homologous end joining protein LigD